VLLEAIRHGTAPAAIITTGEDSFFALAVIVAEELYERSLPVLAVGKMDFETLRTGDHASIDAEGVITIYPPG
jgi:hypothetical protein